MPTKDRSASYPARRYGSWDMTPSGSTKGNYPVTTVQRSLVRTRTGNALPNWFTIIARGGNATTGLTARYENGFDKFGSAVVHFYGDVGNPNKYWGWEFAEFVRPRLWSSINDIGPQAPTLATTRADNGASAKFYKALRKTAVQWSAPTFLGELRESLHMIRHPANALYGQSRRYLDAVSREMRRNPRYWPRALGGLWLEQSFGWAPLINDVKDAYEAYQRLTNSTSNSKIVIGSYSDEADTSSTAPMSFGAVSATGLSGSHIRYRCTSAVRKESCVVRYRAKVTNSVKATQWDNMALFGFTPSEFVPTAWELLPWSFLIDYFANVGDILNAVVTDTKTVNFVNKTVRRLTEYKGTLAFDSDASKAAFSVNCSAAVGVIYSQPSWDFSRKDITRSAGSSVPLPGLQFKFDLGDGQKANIAALLAQAISLHPQNRPRSFPRT